MFAFPTFGHIFNAFSYRANRWCFAFILLCAYILTEIWPSLMKLNKKEGMFLLVSLSVYFLFCLLAEYIQNIFGKNMMTSNIFASMVFVFFFLCMLLQGAKRGKQWIGLLLILVSIFNNSFWQNMAGKEIRPLPTRRWSPWQG